MCCISFVFKDNDKSLVKIDSYFNSYSLSWVNIAITSICNFNCRWCYSDSSSKKAELMPLDVYANILSILKRSGVRQITLGGGEPLLHPDFVQMVKMSIDYGFITNINTNAYFLDYNLIQILSESNVSQIAIDIESIFSMEHDEIRGKIGSFEKAMRAIEELVDRNMNVVIQTVLTNKNSDRVLDVFRMAKKKNVLKFRVLDLLPVGRAANLFSEVPRDLNRCMGKICDEAANLNVKRIVSYDPVFTGNDFHANNIISVNCPSRMGLMGYITTDGTMTYCPSATHIKLYNVLEFETIASIHQTAVRNVNSKIHENCMLCENYDNCGGGCIARRTSVYVDYSCPNIVNSIHYQNQNSFLDLKLENEPAIRSHQ